MPIMATLRSLDTGDTQETFTALCFNKCFVCSPIDVIIEDVETSVQVTSCDTMHEWQFSPTQPVSPMQRKSVGKYNPDHN